MVRTLSQRVIVFFSVTLLALASPGAAHAQHYGEPQRSTGIVRGGSFFGPASWPAYDSAFAYDPVDDGRAELRILVTPREANVYVDGFYSGNVDDFNGFFQRLPVAPGGHEVVLYLDGYRTVHQTVYVMPGSTYKLSYAMEKLGAGETSEPPPVAPLVPEVPPGIATVARTPPGGELAGAPASQASASPAGAPATAFGALVVRVQPGDADIVIDGERWQSSDQADRLVVQVGDGSHHIVIQKNGYRTYSADIVVRRGETTPLNVSLSPE